MPHRLLSTCSALPVMDLALPENRLAQYFFKLGYASGRLYALVLIGDSHAPFMSVLFCSAAAERPAINYGADNNRRAT